MKISSVACAVLLSRNPNVSKAELIELSELGRATFGIQCDAGDSVTLAEVLSWVHEHLPAVSAVAHAAGTLGYSTIDDVTEEQFWDICHAKVRFPLYLPLICWNELPSFTMPCRMTLQFLHCTGAHQEFVGLYTAGAGSRSVVQHNPAREQPPLFLQHSCSVEPTRGMSLCSSQFLPGLPCKFMQVGPFSWLQDCTSKGTYINPSRKAVLVRMLISDV